MTQLAREFTHKGSETIKLRITRESYQAICPTVVLSMMTTGRMLDDSQVEYTAPGSPLLWFVEHSVGQHSV